jgi:hypothetical protein
MKEGSTGDAEFCVDCLFFKCNQGYVLADFLTALVGGHFVSILFVIPCLAECLFSVLCIWFCFFAVPHHNSEQHEDGHKNVSGKIHNTKKRPHTHKHTEKTFC